MTTSYGAMLAAILAATAVLAGCSGSSSETGEAADVGSTVIRYGERDYGAAAWEQVWDVDSLLSRAGLEQGMRLRGLGHITGTDHRNLWIADRTGLLFGLRDGHWTYQGAATGGRSVWAMRAVSPETVAVGSDSRRDSSPLVLVSPEGMRRFDSSERFQRAHSAHIAVLAEDFIDYYSAFAARGISYRLLSGDFTRLRPDREGAAVLRREDGTPIADYPVDAIIHTATFSAGREAYALWRRPRGGDGAIAELRDGVWILREQIPVDLSKVRVAWFGRGDDGSVFLIAAGTGGFVLRQTVGGSTIEQSITGAPLAATSGDLIAVWGLGPDHYWVMDSNGQVWLRSDNEWRTVVRGLYDDDVVFNAAYVAPNGTVHAVADGSFHRLTPQ